MEINVKASAGVTVVELAGDIDSNTAPQAQERILPLVQPAAKILLDMSGVEYMSSAGLRMLLSMYRQVITTEWRYCPSGTGRRDQRHHVGHRIPELFHYS